MKHDDASWHYGGQYPQDLPIIAAGTHIGMFVAWGLLSGLAGEVLDSGEIASLVNRSKTPGQFLFDMCDGQFTDDLLNAEGNAFAARYYNADGYYGDYTAILSPDDDATVYHVTDSWENYDKLRPCLDRRLRETREAGNA